MTQKLVSSFVLEPNVVTGTPDFRPHCLSTTDGGQDGVDALGLRRSMQQRRPSGIFAKSHASSCSDGTPDTLGFVSTDEAG